jgi:PHD-finger
MTRPSQLQKKDSSKRSVESAHCPICKTKAESETLQCDLCNEWYHAKCVDLDDVAFDVLAKLDQLWFCPACKPSGKKLFHMERKILVLEKRFETFEKTVVSKFDELIPLIEQFSDFLAAKKTETSILPQAASFDVNKLVVDCVRDALEAEGKKTTAVFENFQTVNDDNLDRDVQSFVTKVGFDTTKIVNIRRSGPVLKSRSNGRDLPRIIKVKCDSESSKNDLIRAVSKYAQRGTVSKVFARPDRTWQQREKLRRLNKELFEKRSAGEDYWYIDRNTYELRRNDRKFIDRV